MTTAPTMTDLPSAPAPVEAPAPGGVGSKIAAALAAAMSEVRVTATGRNDFHDYDYLSIGDITAAARAALASQGVALSQEILEHHVSEVETRRGTSRRAFLRVRVTFTEATSGQSLTVDAIGEGEDASDKAWYKAQTGAMKYALRAALLISDGGDPEATDAQGRPTAPLTIDTTPPEHGQYVAAVYGEVRASLGPERAKTWASCYVRALGLPPGAELWDASTQDLRSLWDALARREDPRARRALFERCIDKHGGEASDGAEPDAANDDALEADDEDGAAPQDDPAQQFETHATREEDRAARRAERERAQQTKRATELQDLLEETGLAPTVRDIFLALYCERLDAASLEEVSAAKLGAMCRKLRAMSAGRDAERYAYIVGVIDDDANQQTIQQLVEQGRIPELADDHILPIAPPSSDESGPEETEISEAWNRANRKWWASVQAPWRQGLDGLDEEQAKAARAEASRIANEYHDAKVMKWGINSLHELSPEELERQATNLSKTDLDTRREMIRNTIESWRSSLPEEE